MKDVYFDLHVQIPFDTILAIKYNEKWCHYNIPMYKADGSPRLVGDLYHFYTKKPGFRMAYGYIRRESEDCKYWTARIQYMYFGRGKFPVQMSKMQNTVMIWEKSLLKAHKLSTPVINPIV